MLSIKKLNFTTKYKKKFKFIYIFIFFLIFFSIIYFNTPKLFSYSLESIKENLKVNNNIDINDISKVNYKIFPTPRLKIPNSNFTIGKEKIEVSKSELIIILNISQILNFKEVNYKKLIVNNGFLKINLNKINHLLNKDNNINKIILKKINLIFLQEENVFFEINDALIKINLIGKKKELVVNGNFLDNKIFLKLDSSLKDNNNLIFEIPELDMSISVFFEKTINGNINGLFNLEVFNNFLKFNFIKEDSINLTDGFIRSKLFNSFVEGEVFFKPNFYSKLNFKPSNLNIKKLFYIIKKNYFSNSRNDLFLIKKINGIFNFKSNFEGTIINKNGEILFKNFKVGKKKSIYLNARIIEFGIKGKVQFNLITTINYNRNLSKKIEIIGFLIPSNSKVIFEKFLINGNELPVEKVKEYENRLEIEIAQDSLAIIFNENKIKKFFKKLF
jgi:hypothetical protein